MTKMQFTIEILKILFSTQVIAGAFAIAFVLLYKNAIKELIGRIASIKFPGGGELTTSQIEKSKEELPSSTEKPPKPTDESNLPQNLTLAPEQQKTLKELFDAERAKAFFWEYRYLNLFLAKTTQTILDWLASLQSPPTVELADSLWQTAIPSVDERRAILEALRSHYLVDIKNNLLIVTPKGREYIQWRGPILNKKT
jgi:hypothetical protein